MPPPLWEQARHLEAERRGVRAPFTITSFDTVTSTWNRASDHPAVHAAPDP
ncbi:hypothetical protein ACWD0Z_06815 [Streptomyces sp. NPDC003007]